MTKRKIYGLLWDDGVDGLQIEMAMIRKGGTFKVKGSEYGLGLEHHYEEMRKIIWPHLDSHRWHKLCLKEIRRSGAKVTVLIGPGSSGKTHEAAWNYLCEYYVFPTETCVLVSSTDIRGLELRVWGEIKMLHEMARAQFDYLPGNLIDSKHCIATDNVDESSVRDLRRGIVGIPTVQGGKNVGLGKWVGVKQKRMRLIADEAQFMGASFLSAFTNLDKNEDFQAIVLGNPLDTLDPLGKSGEPKDGWESHMEPDKTDVWDTRFMNGRCINLVGTDSPNLDFPADQPARYKYLISKEKIDRTLSFYTKDSVEFYSQCKGVMKIGQLARRVISRQMCEKFGAFEKAIWNGETTNIGALDSSYGGDRCCLGFLKFGKSVDGGQIVELVEKVIVPIRIMPDKIVEDQIAEFCMLFCKERGVPPENFFHDSTGRGTLGTSLARVWSAMCNPVEFGGAPTKRPVSSDLFIFDDEIQRQRLKRCDEHVSKFVTELWFSVRYTIESRQMRGLDEETMEEGCKREWSLVKGDKIEIESKQDMRARVGFSPDLFDMLAIGIEGARRRGFQVAKLAKEEPKQSQSSWLSRSSKSFTKMMKSRRLQEV